MQIRTNPTLVFRWRRRTIGSRNNRSHGPAAGLTTDARAWRLDGSGGRTTRVVAGNGDGLEKDALRRETTCCGVECAAEGCDSS